MIAGGGGWGGCPASRPTRDRPKRRTLPTLPEGSANPPIPEEEEQ